MTRCRHASCTRRPMPHSPWCNDHYRQIVERVFGRSASYPIRRAA